MGVFERLGAGSCLFLASVALLAGVAGPGCASRPSTSFQTLGVPEPDAMPGRAAVILGWARERRGDWQIRAVKVNGRRVRGWNAESQQPVVLYIRPGARSLRLHTAQVVGSDSRRSRRRFRTRPVELVLAEGDVHLCVVRVAGSRRRRPRLECMARATEHASVRPPSPEEGASPADGSEEGQEVYGLFERPAERPAMSELVGSPYTPPDRTPDEEPLGVEGEAGDHAAAGAGADRLRRIEERLGRLERLMERLLRDRSLTTERDTDESRTAPVIDTSPPW